MSYVEMRPQVPQNVVCGDTTPSSLKFPWRYDPKFPPSSLCFCLAWLFLFVRDEFSQGGYFLMGFLGGYFLMWNDTGLLRLASLHIAVLD